RDHRPGPRRAGGLDPAERGRRALRLSGRLARVRHPGLQRADPRAGGVGAGAARAHRGPRAGPLLPGSTGV
ncbi:MAG: hypothetical protein AVDCRST_MAG12-2519, partial [uncultured Rubrobacteraceae bacterium]